MVVCQEKYTAECCIGRTVIWIAVRSEFRSNLSIDTGGSQNFKWDFQPNFNVDFR